MQTCPFYYEALGPWRQRAPKDRQWINREYRVRPSVGHVKVRDPVFPVEHANHDAIEATDLGQDASLGLRPSRRPPTGDQPATYGGNAAFSSVSPFST